MSQSANNKSKEQGCYLVIGFFLLIFLLIIKWVWPNVIPFSLFQFWHFQGSVLDVLTDAWPIFTFGLLLNLASLIRNRKKLRVLYSVGKLFGFTLRKNFTGGVVSSFIAGIFEEIVFRWIYFYSAIVGLQILNFLFFGFLGLGIFHWFITTIEIPVANFLTVGILASLLAHNLWFVGGAILNANGKFQKGHEYLYGGDNKTIGYIGYLASWFLGWFFYYLMFKYGLFASILVHLLYDLMIDIFMFISMSIHKQVVNRNSY